MRRVAIAALPIAISTALQVSGVAGTTAEIIAWCIVFVVISTLLVDFAWSCLKDETVGHAATRLGRELLDFTRYRHATSPHLEEPAVPWQRRLRLRSRRQDSQAARSYQADTMALYQELFADRVAKVIGGLRSTGRLGGGEAAELMPPANPASIEKLGRRLIELGYSTPSAQAD